MLNPTNSPDLISNQAKICFTSSGVLIHQDKILLIKHKKLGIWLAPGGHLDPNELPHQAAEREFWEETGIKVKAINLDKLYSTKDSQNLPSPLITNLHWICKENYQARLSSKQPNKRHKSKKWPKGCEQHVVFIYLVKAVSGVKYKQNIEETDGIAWFKSAQIKDLQTTEDIKNELQYFFKEFNKVVARNA